MGRLMGAGQCLDTGFDLVFVDDVCSFLTPRLVTLLRQRGRSVIGVYDPVDSADAKRRLLECGISDVIESNATPEEFLARAEASFIEPTEFVSAPPRKAGRAFGVIGVGEGVGCTEVAVGVAVAASAAVATTLVDLEPVWPGVLQRLDLAPHPNLRSVIDVTLHGGDLERVLQRVGHLRVAGGSINTGAGAIPVHEKTMVLEALTDRCDVLVADLGTEERVSGQILQAFEAVILVTGSDPGSLTRMLRSKDRILDLVGDASLLVAINTTPRRPYYRNEIRAEVAGSLAGTPFVLLPYDPKLVEAAWDGTPVNGGRFAAEVGRIADLLIGAVANDR